MPAPIPPRPAPPGTSAPTGLLLAYDAPIGPRPRERVRLHVGLFLATFASCTVAGYLMAGRGPVYAAFGWQHAAADGLRYAVGLLGFLTVHEFGHYFAAKRYGVSVSLPYYIPLPIPIPFASIGTLGAVIRLRQPIPRTRALFDIGAAGPLAGFVAALAVLGYGLATLPDPVYLLGVGGAAHAEIVQHFFDTGRFPALAEAPRGGGDLVVFGQTPLFWLLGQTTDWMPPMYEVYHYPWLLAGWLALFFTALNLLPAGQLDGGHVLYAALGPRVHAVVARATTLLLLSSGTLGLVYEGPDRLGWDPLLTWLGAVALQTAVLRRLFRDDLRLVAAGVLGVTGLVIAATWAGLAGVFGWMGWLVWAGLIAFLIKPDHPPVYIEEPLTPGRRALAVVCLLIFLSCFSIRPIYLA